MSNPAPAPAPDPFTQVYQALLTKLVSSEVTAMVRANNIIRLDGSNPDPRKPEVAAADLPELVLYPSGGAIELGYCDDGLKVDQQFNLAVATSDVRVSKGHFPLKWALLKAFWAIKDNLGLAFVELVRLSNAAETLSDDAQNRGMDGWSTLFSVTVTLVFDSSDLSPPPEGD
jgi:hypothetical protein